MPNSIPTLMFRFTGVYHGLPEAPHPLSGFDGLPHPRAVALPRLLTGPLCAAQHATALQSDGDGGG